MKAVIDMKPASHLLALEKMFDAKSATLTSNICTAIYFYHQNVTSNFKSLSMPRQRCSATRVRFDIFFQRRIYQAVYNWVKEEIMRMMLHDDNCADNHHVQLGEEDHALQLGI